MRIRTLSNLAVITVSTCLLSCYDPTSSREPEVSVDMTPVYEYEDATEALLDMISEEWEDFDDVVYGSQEYENYLETRGEADNVEMYLEEPDYNYSDFVRGFP